MQIHVGWDVGDENQTVMCVCVCVFTVDFVA